MKKIRKLDFEGQQIYVGMDVHKESWSFQCNIRNNVPPAPVCSKKTECTRDRARAVSFHIHEQSIEKARQLNKTEVYRISQRMRKRIEKLFGEAKEFMELRQAKFRRTQFVKEQVLMTAAAQNIKRMIKLLTRPGPKADAVAVSAERTRKRTETMVNQCRSFLATVAGSRFAEIIGYAEC